MKVWSGPVEDLPEEYAKEAIPEGCVNVTIYSDGSRIYDRGFTLSEAFRDKINFRMSRCWDSLNNRERGNDREREQV